ncbi:MAG TPA: metallophosphoesterase, partial [Streptosporangiaceae bacterium]
SAAAPPALLSQTCIPQDPVLAGHLPGVLRIHHISDLHHGGYLRSTVDSKDETKAGRRIAALAGAGTPLDSYLGHIRQLASQGLAPHLVIVSGDVVNRPDEQFGEQALGWLTQLRSLLAAHPDLTAQDPRIVLVGGNHDVSWELCLEPQQEARHRWFAETFAGYPHPDLQLADRQARRLFLRYPSAGLRLALLGSAESGGEVSRDEDRELLDACRAEFAEAADQARVRELIHRFERLDPGVVARDVLDRLTQEPGYVTVAVLHHPLSPVPAVEVAPYTGIVNAGQAKRALVAARTSLVLHGHTHLGFLAAERLLGQAPGWTMRIAGAATLASAASDEQNGYNEIFLAREGAGHRILVRPVRLDGGQWQPQSGVAFKPGAPDECALTDLVEDPS